VNDTYLKTLHAGTMARGFTVFVWRATAEWYWKRKNEEFGEKHIPVPLCPSKTDIDCTRAQTRTYAVKGRRPTERTWHLRTIRVRFVFIFGFLDRAEEDTLFWTAL
jgi:hypothetical protein